jgi:glucokinase
VTDFVPTDHLGIDLGVTNVKWATLERRGPEWVILDRGQTATLSSDGPEAVIERIVGIGQTAVDRFPATESIGIGVPGLFDAAAGTTVTLVNMPGDWVNRPLREPIEAALRLPTALINDARAFGLAELRLGAGRGAQSLVGLALGTGVGGFVAVDGHIHLGHEGAAGELGHQTIDPDGPPCNCGNRGCLEAFVRADRIALSCGTETAAAAVSAAERGDERAIAGLAEIGRYLGIGIANAVAIIAPDRVVVGGGVAAAGDLLLEPIRAELQRRIRTEAVEVVGAELGTWAGAIGAAVHGAEEAERAARATSATAGRST